MLLARHTGRRKGRLHDGKVVVMRSNLRWCSDGFEITCWNGDLVRIVFIIDAHDREIIAWHAVAGAGISGIMVRDMMLEAVEKRFAADPGATRRRVAVRQRQRLHGQGDPRLRRRAQSGAVLHARCKARSRTASPKPSSKPSSATMFASTLCRMRQPYSGRSPDGSTTTTRTILTQGSECAPQGSSFELRPQ